MFCLFEIPIFIPFESLCHFIKLAIVIGWLYFTIIENLCHYAQAVTRFWLIPVFGFTFSLNDGESLFMPPFTGLAKFWLL